MVVKTDQILVSSASKRPEGFLYFRELQMRAIIAVLNYFRAYYLRTKLLLRRFSFPGGDIFVEYKEI